MIKDKKKLDSKEELHGVWFFTELKKAGYISGWKFAKPYILSDPIKTDYIKPMKRVPDKLMECHIGHGHYYTPDFEVRWTEKAIGIFIQDIECGEKITTPFISQTVEDSKGLKHQHTIIEIKGDFDYQNMTRLSIINQKWMWDKLKVYVNIVKFPSIFERVFMPKRYIFTDETMGRRTIHFKVRTLEEYVKQFHKKENTLF